MSNIDPTKGCSDAGDDDFPSPKQGHEYVRIEHEEIQNNPHKLPKVRYTRVCKNCGEVHPSDRTNMVFDLQNPTN